MRAGNYGLAGSDVICIPLSKLLEKEGKLSLNEIVKKSALSRQTAFNHLKHLVNDGILAREILKHGRGRPKILYCRTEKTINVLKTEDAVSLRFRNLKIVCRFGKDGLCRKINGYCSSDGCPIILK